MSGLAGVGLALSGVGGFLKRIPWQAWAAIGVALLLAFLVIRGNHWKHEAEKARTQVSADCSAIRKYRHSLACDQTDEQIAFMGQTIGTLTAALNKQNAVIIAMGEETKSQQQNASKASQEATQRAKTPKKVSDSLIVSSRSSERLAKPCEPSKALKGAWQ